MSVNVCKHNTRITPQNTESNATTMQQQCKEILDTQERTEIKHKPNAPHQISKLNTKTTDKPIDINETKKTHKCVLNFTELALTSTDNPNDRNASTGNPPGQTNRLLFANALVEVKLRPVFAIIPNHTITISFFLEQTNCHQKTNVRRKPPGRLLFRPGRARPNKSSWLESSEVKQHCNARSTLAENKKQKVSLALLSSYFRCTLPM